MVSEVVGNKWCVEPGCRSTRGVQYSRIRVCTVWYDKGVYGTVINYWNKYLF